MTLYYLVGMRRLYKRQSRISIKGVAVMTIKENIPTKKAVLKMKKLNPIYDYNSRFCVNSFIVNCQL